jgi:hypothetical protein
VEIGGGRFPRRLDEGRAPAAGIISLRGLDLDYIRPKIGQGLPGPRASQNPRQFDDADAFQRSGHLTQPARRQ